MLQSLFIWILQLTQRYKSITPDRAQTNTGAEVQLPNHIREGRGGSRGA